MAGVSVTSNPRYDELVDLFNKVHRDVSLLPSGAFQAKIVAQLAPIEANLKQMKGVNNGSWVRYPDWYAYPSLFDKNYREFKIKLAELETEMAKYTAAPVISTPILAQPEIIGVLWPSGWVSTPQTMAAPKQEIDWPLWVGLALGAAGLLIYAKKGRR